MPNEKRFSPGKANAEPEVVSRRCVKADLRMLVRLTTSLMTGSST